MLWHGFYYKRITKYTFFTIFTKIISLMRQFIVLLFIGVIISLSSCRKDFSTVPSTGALTFSASKVYLDTIFTNISSSTYMLKVYNHSNKDISIPTIQLGKGLASKYRIMVDGMTGNQGKIFNHG